VMSIEAQLFELREYARKENLEIIDEFQESKSAKTPGREVFGDQAWNPPKIAPERMAGTCAFRIPK